ncbi:MAG: hypothetical protein ACI3XZ_00110 [Butyricicoccus sp.]
MKCPHCGVHYDDGDSECPICGARRPVFQSNPSPLAKSTGKPAEAHRKKEKTSWKGEYVTKTCAHPKKKDCPHTTTLNGKPQKKKSGKGWIIFLIIILVNVLPAIVGLIGEIFEEITDNFRESFVQEEIIQEAETVEPWNEAWEYFPCLGVWGVPDTRAQVIFSQELNEEYGVEQYEIMADGGYQERGVYWWYENTEETGVEFPEEFPASEYRWYTVEFNTTDITGAAPNPQAELDGDVVNGYCIEVFQSRTDSEETWFYGWGVPWLYEDTLAFAQYAGGAEEAGALLSATEPV